MQIVSLNVRVKYFDNALKDIGYLLKNDDLIAPKFTSSQV